MQATGLFRSSRLRAILCALTALATTCSAEAAQPTQPNPAEVSDASATVLYTNALKEMRRLPAPAFARYDIAIDAPGQHISLINLDNGPFIKLGGRGRSHVSSDAAYRNHDGRGAVKLDDGTYAATYYMGTFGGTWSTVHDWMQFGGSGATNNDPPPEQSQTAPELPTIAVVSALNAGSYRVFDIGATECASTSPGHLVHLVARSDPERHPLTDAAIDVQTGRFCMMRFTVTSRHLKCAHMCSAIVELHFGDAGGYSVITDGRLAITWGAVGIHMGRTILNFHFSNFTFPDYVDPQVFVNPKA